MYSNNPSNPQDERDALYEKLFEQMYDDVAAEIEDVLSPLLTHQELRYWVEKVAATVTDRKVQYELDNYDPTFDANPGRDYPDDDDAYFDNN